MGPIGFGVELNSQTEVQSPNDIMTLRFDLPAGLRYGWNKKVGNSNFYNSRLVRFTSIF